MRTITETQKFTRVSNAVAVGTAAINSSSVDMLDQEGVAFIVFYGAITDGTPNLKAQQSSDDGANDAWSDLAGSDVAVADTDDNKMAILEITRPTKRYVRAVVTRGGGTGSVVDGILAIQKATRTPTQGSTVAATEQHPSPVEGTA